MADTDDPFALSATSPLISALDAARAPQPTNDRYQERIDTALGKQDRMIERAEESMGREEQIRAEQSKALAPLRQRITEIATQPLPERPQLKEAPPAPKRNSNEDQETWLMASALLGSLAGAFTRRHQTNALAAFSGAMEGYNEGSRQKFDENMKVWEAENKRTLQANQQAMDHYRGILEDRKLSMDQMSVALQMAAAQYDDNAMATAARTKNSLVIAQLYDKQAEALGRMRTSSESMSLKLEQMRQKERLELAKQQMRALGINDPAKMSATIDAIGSYRAPPIGGRAGTAIMEIVREKYPGYDDKEWLNQRLRAQIPARVEAAAETSAARTQANREAQLDLILRSAKPSIQKAADASAAVPRSTFTHLNQLFQMAESEIGDPQLLTFKLANQQVAEQWAKAMNPSGTMAVAYFNVAQDKLSTATSPEAYMAALKFLDGWLDQEMAAAKSRTPQTITWPDQPAHSTTIPQIPGVLREKEKELGERTGIQATGALPTTQPAEAIQRGQFGTHVDWIKPEERRKFMEMLPGWKVQQTTRPDMPIPPAEGWKVEQVQ